MGKHHVLVLAGSLAMGCGGVVDDLDTPDQGNLTPGADPTEPGSAPAPVGRRVCSIELFDSESGALLYRDVRNYFHGGDLLILDRDTDGDGAFDDQYRYTYAGNAVTGMELDRDLDGDIDYLRKYVFHANGLVDYFLVDVGAVGPDGSIDLSLTWHYIADFVYADGLLVEEIWDDTPDLDFSDHDTDFYWSTDHARNDDDLIVLMERERSGTGIDLRETRTIEDGLIRERTFDYEDGAAVDQTTDRIEYWTYDSEGRHSQIQHDRDNDGDIDDIARHIFDDC